MIKNIAFTPYCLIFWLGVPLLATATALYAEDNRNQPQPPDVKLGPLFDAVQRSEFYSDQKTFADAVPKYDPSSILADWRIQKKLSGFNLKYFIENNFTMQKKQYKYIPPSGQSLRKHINGLWSILTRNATHISQYDSLLPLPKPYVVPGGRFREVYYWDSYFTMLGLAESSHWNQVQDMVYNFAYELDKYGHIPNGNRSYYLSRSQPPFFSLMVDLLATHKGDDVYCQYLPQLKKEYDYWMEDSDKLASGQVSKRVIKLTDGTLLNRYWDARDVPRTESWLDDINTAKKTSQDNKQQIYRDLRSGAASGWDFSSRWFNDEHNLVSIRTTKLAPVDLNSLLFHLEQTLAKASKLAKQHNHAKQFANHAAKRQKAINRYLWNEKEGWYADYDWQKKKVRSQLTAATLFPLYMNLASNKKAELTASVVKKKLLKPGGLVTTTVHSSQQWDSPNGWAPLQWVAVEGLEHYKQTKLAQQIGKRFLQNVQQTYNKEHKLVEKYVVEGPHLGGGRGGEYPLQDGFGWTNGVTLMLLNKYCPKDKICNNANDIPNMPVINVTK